MSSLEHLRDQGQTDSRKIYCPEVIVNIHEEEDYAGLKHSDEYA